MVTFDLKGLWVVLVLLVITLIFGLMWGCPQYNVWEQGLSGQAALAKATQDRQIRIQEAKAQEEAATHYKTAEITRAEGHAAAVKIVGEALKLNPNYINYMWVNGVTDKEHPTIIYVPTEANLPILEAGRRARKTDDNVTCGSC